MNKKAMITFGVAALSCVVTAPAIAATGGTDFSITVGSYLNVTLSSSDVHLPITPSSGGTFNETSFYATSSTNNAYGYKLNLSITDTNTAAAQLTTNLTSDTINVNDGSNPVIPTFSTNDVLTSAQFSASSGTDHLNHWAISLNDTNHYQAVESESTIATSDGPVVDDVTTMNLATKLDLLTPPGHYSAYFNFLIVANPMPEPESEIDEAISQPKIDVVAYVDENDEIIESGDDATGATGTRKTFSLHKMQDMTHAVCDAVTTPTASDYSDTPTTRLVDARDGKIYWVAKLKDGKCWMTQNLDFELKSNVMLTHANTDLGWTVTDTSAQWAPNKSTLTSLNSWTYQDQNDQPEYSPFALNPGKFFASGTWYNDYYPYINAGTASTVLFNTTPYANNGAHGHVGDYYSYAAATAQNDTSYYDSSSSGTAPNSICPAGWRLPTANYPLDLDGEASDDYSNLMYAYFSNDISGTSIAKSAQYLLNDPLYLVPNGYVSSQTQSDSGQSARYISSAGVYDSGGYNYKYLFVGDSFSYSSLANMYIGGSIRCVAR